MLAETAQTAPGESPIAPVWGLASLLAAVLVALAIGRIEAAFPGDPDRAVQAIGACLGAAMLLPIAAYLARKRRAARPSGLAAVALGSIGVGLVANYLYVTGGFVFFPADILIWSEGEFVADIVKLRAGHPLYTDQVNNESFIYPPGAQVLTYALAALGGHATSIPAYRVIQLLYGAAAALVAARCCAILVDASRPADRPPLSPVWGAVFAPLLFLVATNRITNEFAHNLHNDALAQLLSVVGYWLLLEYHTSRRRAWLVAMAFLPAAGVMVKQSVAIWGLLFVAYLALFDRPRSWARVLAFGAVGFALGCAVLGAAFLVWGEPFYYWLFVVMGAQELSTLRVVEHLLAIGPYLAIGIAGGAALLPGREPWRLLGPWLVALALLGIETWTSGIAWMLNHMGPGCLLAAIWGVAGLTRFVTEPRARVGAAGAAGQAYSTPGEAWLKAGAAVAAVPLLAGQLGVQLLPLPHLSADAHRYAAEIEAEFEGVEAGDVLLDAGSWLYLPTSTVVRDRVVPIADRGYSGVGDFSGILERLETQRYAKILMRNVDQPNFFYESNLWEEPSGIRQALLDNYRVDRRIAAVERNRHQFGSYFLGEISVLVPAEN